MGRLLAIALLVLGNAQAEAAPVAFRDLAATPDGAWLVAVTGDHRTELRRVDLEGRHVVEAPPTKSEIKAIASADRSLWVVTIDEVAKRDANGTWTMVPLPDDAPVGFHDHLTDAAITPLDATRALVITGCRAPPKECSLVLEVDLGASRIASTQLLVKMRQAVPDGRGGAWAVFNAEMHQGYGYARYAAGRWQQWSYDGRLEVEGMENRGASIAIPELLAARGPGVVGAGSYARYELDADGHGLERHFVGRDNFTFTNHALAALATRDEVIVVSGIPFSSLDGAQDETSPVVRRYDRTGKLLETVRVPTPRWWQREHSSDTPPLHARMHGRDLWIMTADAVFFRTTRWHTIEASGAEAHAPPATKILASAPMSVGYLHAGDEGVFGVTLRPELVIATNRMRPRLGVGAFLELGAGIDRFAGGGLTVVAYDAALSFSAGVDAVSHAGDLSPQLVFSLFLGHRADHDLGPIDLPFGVRVDVRPGTSALPASVMVGASIDLVGVGLAVYAVGEFLGWASRK